VGIVSQVEKFLVYRIFLAGELSQHMLSPVNIAVFSSSFLLAINKEHLYCEACVWLTYSTFSVTFQVYVVIGMNIVILYILIVTTHMHNSF
jgi:hypothetical protein